MADYLRDEQVAKETAPLEFFAKCGTCSENIAKYHKGRQVQTFKCKCRRDWEHRLEACGIDPKTVTYKGKKLTFGELTAILNGKGANPSVG